MASSLNKASVMQSSDYSLAPGQLTSKGFMQHVQLGELLYNYYAARKIPFLATISSADQVYIRSTNYARTIQVILLYDYIFIRILF